MKEKTFKGKKPIIAVTMGTSRQGLSVVEHLSKTNHYKIRAITRNPLSNKAVQLARMQNVEVVKGDLLNSQSLEKAFKDAYGIYGNTTPTKGWKFIRGSMVHDYEIEQGKTLFKEVKKAFYDGNLKHFIFSSICKPKNPLKNSPAPGHFTNKWNMEDYIKQDVINSITTIIRPVSYFENFETNLPIINLSKKFFPGLVNPHSKWQTIAVDDIGLWTTALFKNKNKYKNKSINIAGEELTGKDMAKILNSQIDSSNIETKYIMLPRYLVKIIEKDLAIMAEWIERTGYGADMENIKLLTQELNIKPTSLKSWLQKKINNKEILNNYKDNSIVSQIL